MSARLLHFVLYWMWASFCSFTLTLGTALSAATLPFPLSLCHIIGSHISSYPARRSVLVSFSPDNDTTSKVFFSDSGVPSCIYSSSGGAVLVLNFAAGSPDQTPFITFEKQMLSMLKQSYAATFFLLLNLPEKHKGVCMCTRRYSLMWGLVKG